VTQAEAAHAASVRAVADRTGAEAEATTRQANAAAEIPALREGEARESMRRRLRRHSAAPECGHEA
jgi:hypothetical protein